jgi:hypothetical protein
MNMENYVDGKHNQQRHLDAGSKHKQSSFWGTSFSKFDLPRNKKSTAELI